MVTQRWLEDVQTELSARRLPRRYVTRLMRELSDHIHDGLENPMSMEARAIMNPVDRLGLPEAVAAAAADEYRKRRFAVRHPFLTFAVGPVLLLPVVSIAFIAAPLWIVGTLLEWLEVSETTSMGPVIASGLEWFNAASLTGAAALLVIAFAGLGRRTAVHWRWSMIAGILLAMIAGAVYSEARARTADHQGVLMIGIGYPIRMPTIHQWIQFIVPLGAAGWMTWRQRRLESAAIPG
jgi:hypothetical protein